MYITNLATYKIQSVIALFSGEGHYRYYFQFAKNPHEQAEPLYQQALEIVNQRLGVSHLNTVTFRNNLESLRDKLSIKQRK